MAIASRAKVIFTNRLFILNYIVRYSFKLKYSRTSQTKLVFLQVDLLSNLSQKYFLFYYLRSCSGVCVYL